MREKSTRSIGMHEMTLKSISVEKIKGTGKIMDYKYLFE